MKKVLESHQTGREPLYHLQGDLYKIGGKTFSAKRLAPVVAMPCGDTVQEQCSVVLVALTQAKRLEEILG